MGGNPFGTGAGLEDLESWREPVEDRSGIRLELEAPPSFAFGAPVTVQVKLTSADPRGIQVTKHIRPRNGNVEIAIAQPGGRIVEYEPLLRHCMSDEDAIVLGGEQQAYADRAFIHYGKEGFYFDQPGTYRLRARYTAPDGSVIVSETLTLRVRPPATAEDVEVADLFFGDEQGTLMYLVGSDFDGLQRGNDALTHVWEEHPEPPARGRRPADPGRQRRAGVQADTGGQYRHVREPDIDAAIGLLAPLFDLDAVRKIGGKRKDELEKTAAVARRLRTEIAPASPTPRSRATSSPVGVRSQQRWGRRSTDRSGPRGAAAGRSPQTRGGRLGQWRLLRIDLQGGFDTDTVEVWVDEERRWREEAVTTKFTLDLAASVPLEVPEGPADVRVVLPERGIEQALEALVAGETYVVARVENDRLQLEQLAEAPYYL